MRCLIGWVWFVFICAIALKAAAPDGETLFKKNCALCHKSDAANRTPKFEALKWVPNGAIVTALESGSMTAQGSTLSAAEREAIADYLAPRPAPSVEPARVNSCDAGAPPLSNLN